MEGFERNALELQKQLESVYKGGYRSDIIWNALLSIGEPIVLTLESALETINGGTVPERVLEESVFERIDWAEEWEPKFRKLCEERESGSSSYESDVRAVLNYFIKLCSEDSGTALMLSITFFPDKKVFARIKNLGDYQDE